MVTVSSRCDSQNIYIFTFQQINYHDQIYMSSQSSSSSPWISDLWSCSCTCYQPKHIHAGGSHMLPAQCVFKYLFCFAHNRKSIFIIKLIFIIIISCVMNDLVRIISEEFHSYFHRYKEIQLCVIARLLSN